MKSILSLMAVDLKLVLKNIFFLVLTGMLAAIILTVNFLLPKEITYNFPEPVTCGFEMDGYRQDRTRPAGGACQCVSLLDGEDITVFRRREPVRFADDRIYPGLSFSCDSVYTGIRAGFGYVYHAGNDYGSLFPFPEYLVYAGFTDTGN